MPSDAAIDASTNVRWFSELGLADLEQVGGKNSSLGEMISNLSGLGVRVPDGFATTAEAYRRLHGDTRVWRSGSTPGCRAWTPTTCRRWPRRGKQIREAVVTQPFPPDLEPEIRGAYEKLAGGDGAPGGATSSVVLRGAVQSRRRRTCRTRRSRVSRRRS